jgi:RNA polymerase sigma factor (sigma-70 family)
VSERSGNGTVSALEASALQHTSRVPVLPGRSPLLRLQSDEKLIALTRAGNQGAFETLVQRYQSRLLAFCRHMLGSTEDAEDVLQEVFAASFNAMLADERPINARPWLYRIARNRCLNHLRRPTAAGQDSMDVFERDGGTTTADTVHKREEFRQIVADVQELPETQRTALLLREIDALSYEQIAEAMDTTVPSVKSLLVRARVSLGEAAEARLLSCGEVRLELGQVAEGLARTSAPVRRHLKTCERCRTFRSELRRSTRALAAVYPVGPLVALKLFVGKLGIGAGSGAAAHGSGAGGIAGAAGGAGATVGGTTAGGALSAGVGTLASKAIAGIAAAAIVTAGAAEVKHVTDRATSERDKPAAVAVVDPPADPAAPELRTRAVPQPVHVAVIPPKEQAQEPADETLAADKPVETAAAPPAAEDPTPAPPTHPAGDGTGQQAGDGTQQDGSTVVLDPPGESGSDSGAGNGGGTTGSTGPTTPPGERSSTPAAPTPSAPAGEQPR